MQPPAPGADPLEPQIQLGEEEIAAPSGHTPSVSQKSKGKARQSRQAARKSKQKTPAPKAAAQTGGQPHVYVQKLVKTPAQVPSKGPQPAASGSPATAAAGSPRVFVKKIKSDNGTTAPAVSTGNRVVSNQPAKPTTKKAKKSRVIVPVAKAVVWTVKKLAEQNRKRVAKKKAKVAKKSAQSTVPSPAPKPVIKIIQSPAPKPKAKAKPVAKKSLAPASKAKPQSRSTSPAPVQKPRAQSKLQPKPQKHSAIPTAPKSSAPAWRKQTAPQTAAVSSAPAQSNAKPPPPRPLAKAVAQPPPRPVAPKVAIPPPRPTPSAPPPRPDPAKTEALKTKARATPVPGWVTDDQKMEFASRRSLSVDAFRGLLLVLFVSGGFGLAEAARHPELAGSWVATMTSLLRPTEWIGLSPWDLILAAFVILVGVALPYSCARREEFGQTWNQMFAHACGRAGLFVALGVFIQSAGQDQTDWQFTNVLCQIGLGYVFAFMMVGRGMVMQLGYLALVLGGYTAIFIHYDAMGFGLSAAELGVSEDDLLPGAFAPFTRDVNFAAGFDRWFLNLFPRDESWQLHPEGMQTLNFIPIVATMLIGVMAGELMRAREEPELKFNALLMAGVPCLLLGVLLGISFCPIISRLWTASWVFVSAAFVLWALAGIYWFVELWGKRIWVWPLAVLGANSLLVYLGAKLLTPSIVASLELHLGENVFSGAYGPVWQSLAVMGVIWSVCAGLYARRFFVRI